uniref:Racemase n=1 Tax=Clostridium innocuum TaxID=1522 RepID=Q6JH78_CLOIN|nr:racemase [[Clostridium] innocuum]
MENVLKSNTPSWLEIDLTRISHNIKEVQKLIPSTSKIMAIVKANGYGHGDVECSRMMEQQGIDFFGVSSVDEGVRLRENGIQSPILVLGYTPPVHFHYLNEASLIQTLVSKEYAEKLNAYAKEQNVVVKAHAKVNTGMSRIGISHRIMHIISRISKALVRLKHLNVSGIFSHFSVSDCLDEENCAFTNHQIALFERVLADLRPEGLTPVQRICRQLWNFKLSEPALDYVRPGLLWMGVPAMMHWQFARHRSFSPHGMEGKCFPGKGYSARCYGQLRPSFQAEVCTRVATLAVGYADGFPRSVSNQGACVLLHGRRVPIIGNICMDQMMVDITGLDGVSEGDVATLIGCDGDEVLSVDELSRLAHTINNETLCWISQRVPRIYK